MWVWVVFGFYGFFHSNRGRWAYDTNLFLRWCLVWVFLFFDLKVVLMLFTRCYVFFIYFLFFVVFSFFLAIMYFRVAQGVEPSAGGKKVSDPRGAGSIEILNI